MAAQTLTPAMTGDRTLHPFFSRPSAHPSGHENSPADDTFHATNDASYNTADVKIQPNSTKQPNKSCVPHPTLTQKTLQEVINPSISAEKGTGQVIVQPDNNVDCMIAMEASPLKKRRRTSLEERAESPVEGEKIEAAFRSKSPQVVVPDSSSLPIAVARLENGPAPTPPKKMLRLNASGKFSSPVSNKSKDEERPLDAPRRRGRPRKSKEVQQPKQLLAVMKYRTGEGDIGAKIDRILSGVERQSPEKKLATLKKPRLLRKQQPPKVTHPFFSGKPKEPEPKQPSPRKASAATPGKLRRHTMEARSPVMPPSRQVQDYAVGSGLLKDRLMFKHPGAKEPAWPTREQSHVRGFEFSDSQRMLPSLHSPSTFGGRKRKSAKMPFPIEESLLSRFSRGLCPEQSGKLREDGFYEPHPSLTLPTRLLIAGQEIARRICAELSTLPTDGSADELALRTLPEAGLHPASWQLYHRLQTTLSAFDDGRGELCSWVQKYQPTSTLHVLQPSQEMNVLRDWLTSLTINAVIGMANSDSRPAKIAALKPKKKRRRKAEDMDDFLVPDDEVIHDMDELTEPEDQPASSIPSFKALRSIVQNVSEGVKLSNVVLLSGPHGCGKSAAAHAVAKELGFKIFEINPGERRAGKDILDKVGDMTENHLVKHHGTETAEHSSAEEPGIDEAFQRDLASGRQGTMNSFFKPKAPIAAAKPTVTSSSTSAEMQKKSLLDAVHKVVKRPSKEQKQSLILLEEVDVLFKEDKEFWNTVFKLIQSSKRPFILTCNDEDLVPLQHLSFHAVLRFSPPPTEVVADYLLLMAASEGHLLKRAAITSLYQFKGHDLRATIAELNFWCQMGVGDPRLGLSWIYQRYPPGSDLDAEGRKLRIVSEDTFQPAMIMPGNDNFDDETQILQVQQQYGRDATHLLGWDDIHTPQRLSLKSFCSAIETLSAADVYAGRFAATVLDTTQPEIPDKTRSHYIDGMRLLQADEDVDYSGLTPQLATTSQLLAIGKSKLISTTDHHSRIRTARQTSSTPPALTRHDFACFDAIASPSESVLSTGPGLIQSVFDGPLNTIAVDLAPYVRSIARHEINLGEQREQLNGILSDGRHIKRARTTRAARSALEGGQRASTRRDKWFPRALDLDAVLATAGQDWPHVAAGGDDTNVTISREGSETPASSMNEPQVGEEPINGGASASMDL